MKICSACKIEKDETEFAWKSKFKGLRQSRCRECYREYNRNYYNNTDRDKQIARAQRNQKAVYERYQEWKQQQVCTCCGENSPECLELHHLDPQTKETHPSDAVTRGWKKFMEEAEKCVVLCSNCHKKVHSGRINLSP